MKTRIASALEKAQFGYDIAITYDYVDVAAATTATAVPGPSVLAGAKVQVVGHKLITAFDGGAGTALTLSVGDGGSATALMAATVIAVDGTEVYWHVGGSAKVYLVDDAVDFFWTDAGSMAYTSGQGVVYLRVENMTEWPVAS